MPVMYVTYVSRVTHVTIMYVVCMYGLCEIGYSKFPWPITPNLGTAAMQPAGATVETVLGIAVSAVRMMMPAAPGNIADTLPTK